MGTYDTIGGTPRSPDEEEPCEFWDEENKCENTDCPKYNKEIEDDKLDLQNFREVSLGRVLHGL